MVRLKKVAVGEDPHELELQYQRAINDTLLLTKDEDIRRLRIRTILLKDDNDFLNDELAVTHDTNETLSVQCEDLSAQIEAKIEIVRAQENQIRKQEREYNNLKTELQSMNNVTQDSAKLLSEKLSLSRELSVIKPEIEHLQSQVKHQQSILAEKLALEHQVQTLEVELANERKAAQHALENRENGDRVEEELRKKLRHTEKKLASEKTERSQLEDQLEQEKEAHQLSVKNQGDKKTQEADLRKKLQDAQKRSKELKDEKDRVEEELQAAVQASKKAQAQQADTGAEDELRAQLEEAQNKIQAQQKESKKIRQENQAALGDAEARSDQLEKKLERMRNKLREATEQLKQTQVDLKEAKEARPPVVEAPTKKSDNKAKEPSKKKPAEAVEDLDFMNLTIQTPDGVGTKSHKPKKEVKAVKPRRDPAAAFGEKSTFSITPFLNRSKEDMEDEDDADHNQLNDSILGGRPPQDVSHDAGPPEEAHEEPEAPEVEEEAPKKAPKGGRGKQTKKPLDDAPSARQNAKTGTKATKPTAKAAKAAAAKNALPEEPAPEQQPAEQEVELPAPEEPAEAAAPEPVKKAAKELKPKPKKATQKRQIDFNLPQYNNDESELLDGEKRKKRKLGNTLFDDDDGHTIDLNKKEDDFGFKPKRMKAPLTAGVKNALGGPTFSPRKRDKKGVKGSFLM